MKFKVTDTFIECVDPTLTVGDNKYLVEFEFDDAWDGLTKTARFITVNGEENIVLVNDKCSIADLKKGTLLVGVFSTNKATIKAKLKVSASIINDSLIADPEPSVYEQIITLLNTVDPKLNRAEAAATTAETKAAEALASKTAAETAKTTAVSAKDSAVSAKNDAVTAKNDAVSAKNDALTYKTAAETAQASIEASATQIATNKADIMSIKNDLMSLGLVVENNMLCVETEG